MILHLLRKRCNVNRNVFNDPSVLYIAMLKWLLTKTYLYRDMNREVFDNREVI